MRLVKLKDCCTIKPPKSEAKKLLNDDERVSFVPMNNLGINTPHLVLDDEKPLSEVSGSYTYFAENDVLLAKITPCFENGKLGIARGLTNGIGFGSSEFIVFRPNDELLPEYLYYFLLRPNFREQGQTVMTGAVGHKRIPNDFIENTEIPLPSIDIQKRVVTILDSAFTGIGTALETAEKNLVNGKELFDSYLQSIFNMADVHWIEIALGKIANFKNGLNFSQSSKGESLKVVGVKDFRSNFWVPINQLDTVQIDGELDESYELQSGDILTVRSNGNKRLIGRCLLVDELEGKTSYSGFTIRIRLASRKVLPEFLTYYLKSGSVHEMLIGSGGGANISNLNQKVLDSLPVKYPDKKIQNELITKIKDVEEHCSSLIDLYSRKLQALDELKKSILEKAFMGELTKSNGVAA